MSKKIFILFTGFGQKINSWNDKPTNFLSKLLKKGKVFAYQNKWMEQQNDYSLSYLTMEGFIKDVYDNMIKAIPNAHKYKWIPIGESFGGCLALVFSTIYKDNCSSCILLDNPQLFTLKNNKYRIKMTEEMLGEKFKKLTETKLKYIMKNNPDYLIDYGVISFTKFIQKNIIGKAFKVPVFGFYNIEFPDHFHKEFKYNVNDVLFDEINKLKKLDNFHYNLFVNAGHMIYLDKTVINCILEKI